MPEPIKVIGDVYQAPGTPGDGYAYTLEEFFNNFDFADTDPMDILQSLLTSGEYDWSADGTIQRFTCLDADALRGECTALAVDPEVPVEEQAVWTKLAQLVIPATI